ncbi:MAG: hypothetical protein M3430_20710 [Acidobacteriota bacterium]|nr:hypothetical protein [Acidobacteriota bacterium]
MDPLLIIGSLLAAGAGGVGLGVGARLMPVGLRAARDLRRFKNSEDGETERRVKASERARRLLGDPPGRKRDSNIVGLYGDVLRRKDGSYTRVYDFPLQHTFYSHESVNEQFCDEIGRLLAVPKPENTVMQYRYAVTPDPGRAVAAHLRARAYERVHLPAARLHDNNVDFYRALAVAGAFRVEQASFNITVPAKHEDDGAGQGVGAFLPALAEEIKEVGFRDFAHAFAAVRADTKDDGVVRRLVAHEREAYERVEKVFRFVEMQSPVSLRRLSREELWNSVFASHCPNHTSVPHLNDLPGFDVRDYLCAETIDGGGWYQLHGRTPVAMVSMMRPGDPQMFATSMRALTANPELVFRHTLVAEFIHLDKRKAIKALDRRTRSVKRTNNRADGKKSLSPEAIASLADLQAVRDHVTGTAEALVKMRFYALVYGRPARSRAELRESLNELEYGCERMVTAMQSIEGVEAAIEEPAALRSLYPQTMVGCADHRPNGREFLEVANSLAAAVPIESSWRGSARPHTLFSTTTGRLIGFNLFDKSVIKSPVVTVYGQPGAGKSTINARLVNDVLASVPDARVCAVDIGGSLAPHAESIGARYLRLSPDDPRTINIWDYPELIEGIADINRHTTNITLIVMDALSLANGKEEDAADSDILTKAVTQVIYNFVTRNGPGKPKSEPTHAFLVEMLESYDFGAPHLNARAHELALSLSKYVGNRHLDAPTHEDFCAASPYDVYELDSLDAFQPDVRQTLANRVAARAVRTVGKLKADGTRTPTLLVFDEVWKLIEYYPSIMRVIQKGARTGRRENVVTMLATHTYDDFRGNNDVTKTAGCKLIGLQDGNYDALVADAKLSPRAVSAINSIKNVDGEYTQWVMVMGSGQDQIVETIQCDLAPAELWTFTTNAYERDARARVSYLNPGWSQADVIAWLAEHYPRGLAAHGLIEIDESPFAGA